MDLGMTQADPHVDETRIDAFLAGSKSAAVTPQTTEALFRRDLMKLDWDAPLRRSGGVRARTGGND